MKLKPTFSYSLPSRIITGCIASARIDPQDEKESLVTVSTSNKIVIQGVESSLHISDKVRCLDLLRLDDNRDALVIGTDSHVIAYDAHDNVTLFQREVPDGVNAIAIGTLGNMGPLILCGGNCAIWGFNVSGEDEFWTVTGDRVTALALADLDGDEENELVVGSEDYEIRLFKGDLMRDEIIENDVVTSLKHIKGSVYAYALGNGSVGVYDNTDRLWRTKAKVNIVALFPFPSTEFVACVWAAGKIDIRRARTGDDIMKEQFNGEFSGAIRSRSGVEKEFEMTVAFGDGKVRGLEMEQPENEEQDPALLLREFGQRKHNLLVELNNFEQDERVGMDEPTDFRIPANTQVKSVLHINLPERRIELEMMTDQKVPIRGVVILAEGIFDGESHVQLQDSSLDLTDSMVIPIYPKKDMYVEMHVHTVLGYPQSDMANLVHSRHRLPRFARFAMISSTDAIPVPESRVLLTDIEIRPIAMADWIANYTIVMNAEQITISPDVVTHEFKFVRCVPCEKSYLIFGIDQGRLTIYCDDLEAVSGIIQSLAFHSKWEEVSSHAIFPKELENIEKIVANMDRMYEVRDKLGTDISEKHSLLKEMILRAEDAISIDEMNLARKYYTRLRNVERAVRQDYMVGSNNHESLVTSLRSIHKMIEIASKLRVGPPSQAVVTACREAISSDNLGLLPKIMEFGAQ